MSLKGPYIKQEEYKQKCREKFNRKQKYRRQQSVGASKARKDDDMK